MGGTNWSWRKPVVKESPRKKELPLSCREDLPEEAKALLITPEKCFQMGRGGLATSRWAPNPQPLPPKKSSPSESDSTESQNSSPAKSESVLSQDSTASSTSCFNPEADEFTPTKVSIVNPQTNEFSPTKISTVNPKAKEFTPTKVSTVNPEAKEFTPIKYSTVKATTVVTPANKMGGGLASSKWAPHPSVETPAVVQSAVFVTPSDYVPPHLRIGQNNAFIKKTNDDLPAHLSDTQTTSSVKNNTFIPPHLRTITDNTTVKKTSADLTTHSHPERDTAVTQTHNNTVHNLATTQFSTDRPVSILNNAVQIVLQTGSSVLIKGAERKSKALSAASAPHSQAPPNTPAMSPTTPSKDTSTLNASAKAFKQGWLAESWEEFMTPRRTPVTTQTKTHANSITKDPDIHNQGPFTGKLALPSAAVTSGEHTSKSLIDLEKKSTSSTKQAVYPRTVVQSSPPKAFNDLEDPKDVHAALMKDLTEAARGHEATPLTREALIETTGGAPLDSGSHGMALSDDGVEENAKRTHTGSQQLPRDSRNYLAHVPVGLQDLDGTWGPVPASWEHDRDKYNDDYIPTYVEKWAQTVLAAEGVVDMTREEFKTGLNTISSLKFVDPIAHPLCYPDVENSENLNKQRIQTAEIDSREKIRIHMKQQRARERYALAETENNLRIAEQQPTVNPNTPKIPIYLRPAEDRDIPGVTAIYNHYVTNTDLTEDQEPISELAMGEIFLLARKEDFPFIVAIAGKAPEKGRKKNRETVLGYARAEGFYGLGGTSKGRSRFTAQIEFWVHHKYLRKGVGRSLLDRMLQCTASMHAGKDGYDFVIPDPKDKAVYGTFGGAGGDRKYHQIMLQRPIEIRNDPDHAWLKTWLETRFFFFQVARLQSIARTKTAGGPLGAKWMDVVIFQFEATQPGQFPIFL